MALTLCILLLSFYATYGRELEPLLFRNICLNQCTAECEEPWSYRGLNGPWFWSKDYPDCKGDQQSPVPISSRGAKKDENLAKLDFNGYDQPLTQATVVNNGHTVQVNLAEDDMSRTISVNGDNTYSLRQFHFHWGDNAKKGSEHTLDGTRYTMEMHLVHINSQGQIAVVGFFFKEQGNDNEELQKLVNEFPNVKYKGDQSSLQSEMDLSKLLPANPTLYYRYQGSLTTPPCTEGVTWSVVPGAIPVGTAQMKQFRQLYSVKKEEATDSCRIVNNYRPLQPLLGRQVYRSV